MLPNFLIIGVEKGGTSWLWQNLRQHPDVFMPQVKEIHFFDKDLNWEKGLSWYAEFFSSANIESAIGEASPGYMPSPKAPQRIKGSLPNARLITTIRHPVDRAYSSYRMAISKSHIPPLSFDEAIIKWPQFLEHGLYGVQLKRYFDVFTREQILIILFDDLQNNPAIVLNNVLDFLGISTDFSPSALHEKHAPSRTVKYPALNSFVLASAQVLRNNKLNALIKLGKRLRIREFLFKWNTRIESYRPLTSEKRQEYLSFFQDDLDILEKLLEIDLDHWRQ